MVDLDSVFSEAGPLARVVKDFRARPFQVDMATAVAEAIASASVLVAEAGTGTGKTFAYLVPALLSGGKVIISTGTKTLQDQLFDRDLPTVRRALNVPVTVALLKGRANYVCHYQLERALNEGMLPTRDEAGHAVDVEHERLPDRGKGGTGQGFDARHVGGAGERNAEDADAVHRLAAIERLGEAAFQHQQIAVLKCQQFA